MLDFKCNFTEMDFTKNIERALKLETVKMILRLDEIGEVEKIVILKELLHVSPAIEKEAEKDDGK